MACCRGLEHVACNVALHWICCSFNCRRWSFVIGSQCHMLQVSRAVGHRLRGNVRGPGFLLPCQAGQGWSTGLKVEACSANNLLHVEQQLLADPLQQHSNPDCEHLIDVERGLSVARASLRSYLSPVTVSAWTLASRKHAAVNLHSWALHGVMASCCLSQVVNTLKRALIICISVQAKFSSVGACCVCECWWPCLPLLMQAQPHTTT